MLKRPLFEQTNKTGDVPFFTYKLDKLNQIGEKVV